MVRKEVTMSERRRMMMAGDSGFISQNLLLWFDGKEYLDDSKWYPKILQNGELVKYGNYLTKYGIATYNSTKGCFSKSSGVGFYASNSNLVTAINGSKLSNFTIMASVNLTTASSGDSVMPFASVNVSGVSGQGRGYVVLRNGDKKMGVNIATGNNSNWSSPQSSVTVPTGTKVINLAFVRNGSNIYFYLNGSLLGSGQSITTTGFTTSCTGLNSYSIDASGGTNTQALDYYSCAIYNRALTSDEIASMCKYLNNRYNLKV